LSTIFSAAANPAAYKFENDGKVENVLTRRPITKQRPLLIVNRKARPTT